MMSQGLENHLLHQTDFSEDFFWHRLRWVTVSGYFPRERPVKILDIGAGNGVTGRFVQKHFKNVDYFFSEPIDSLNTHLVNQFGKDKNVTGNQDISKMDYILLLDVLEHIQEDRVFIKDLITQMKEGAHLIITVPALMSLWSDWDRAVGHYRRYHKNDFKQIIRALPEADAVELSYLFPTLILPGYFRRFSKNSERDTNEAHFPNLPKWVNRILYAIGRAGLFFRNFNPCGTSLFVVLKKKNT